MQTRIAQRLIGDFSFSAVQRSYDGAQFHYALGKGDVTVFGARTTRGVYQIDGMGELDVDVYYGALTLPTGAEHSAGELRLFGVGYVDHRTSVLKTDNRPRQPARRTRGDSNRNLRWRLPPRVQTGITGKFDFFVWGAIQTGAWGRLAQRAGAFVGEFGWQPPVKTLKPWLSAGYSYGSGDGNSSDSVRGTSSKSFRLRASMRALRSTTWRTTKTSTDRSIFVPIRSSRSAANCTHYVCPPETISGIWAEALSSRIRSDTRSPQQRQP